ncbi:hypothetical protein BsWGS_19710 [Bradybaena similaris]
MQAGSLSVESSYKASGFCVCVKHWHIFMGWVIGEITFFAQRLLHQRSGILSLAKNHILITFLGENFATVIDQCSISEDPMNARSYLNSKARLCDTIYFKYTAHCQPS